MAAAIASIALGQDEATVDGNIARVMSRLHADGGPRRAMWAHARAHMPAGRAGDYNQALMDLGARICRPKRAACEACPVGQHCEAFAHDTVHLYPAPKAKKAVPTRRIEAFWFERDGAVLLMKRPAEGLWGGLWELPSVASGKEEWGPREVHERFEEAYGVPPISGSVRGARRHVLSHKVFEFRLVDGRGTAPSTSTIHTDLRWVSADELSTVGLSALTSKAISFVWP